jgi:hypothetical protein
MKRLPSACLAACLALAAGRASATAYVVDLTIVPTPEIVNNQLAYTGVGFFPDIFMVPGDSIVVNVDYGGGCCFLPRYASPPSSAWLNVFYGTQHEGAFFVTSDEPFYTEGAGFSFPASVVYDAALPIPPDVGFDIKSISFLVAQIPEPNTWAMMLVGFAATGAMLRGKRRAITF